MTEEKESKKEPDIKNNSNSKEEIEKIRHMIEFGLQGKAELSSIVVAVSIGLFGILTLFVMIKSDEVWWALTISYWVFYGLGVWTLANHQMFASISDWYLREKINPTFIDDLDKATEGNFLARIIFYFWKKKEYRKQTGRAVILLGSYTVVAILLYVTIAFKIGMSIDENIVKIPSFFQNGTG